MLFDRWLPDPIEREALGDSGLDLTAFERLSRVRLRPQVAAMRPVLARFAEYVARRQAAAAGAVQI
jgi:hypothetical protein